MITPLNVRALAQSFHAPSDGQALKSQELISLLLDSSPDPFSRSQYTPGHITCTGLVLSADAGRILLVHHRRLNRWLLPGGHVEPTDPEIWDAARREVREETSVDLLPDDSPRLVGMDVHGIPSNGREPYHLHHDLLFAFRAASDSIACSEESHDVRWCAPREFSQFALPGNVLRAYRRLVAA